MKLIPAIDLKNGKCVRLSEGKEDTSVVFNDNPIKQAIFFEKEGCKRIHIVDLDAAFGNRFDNTSLILDIRKAVSIDIELGGGIKSEKQINFWIKNGINYLIIGSMAMKYPKSFKKFADKFPNKLYVSLDDLNGKIMINGWVENSNYRTQQIVLNYNDYNIRGFVFTDISRDGMLTGININKMLKYLKISNKRFIVGGGVSSNEDIKNISNLNEKLLEGVIVGKSFYLGKINIQTALKTLRNNA